MSLQYVKSSSHTLSTFIVMGSKIVFLFSIFYALDASQSSFLGILIRGTCCNADNNLLSDNLFLLAIVHSTNQADG